MFLLLLVAGHYQNGESQQSFIRMVLHISDGEEVHPDAWGEIETILSETTQVLMYGIIPDKQIALFLPLDHLRKEN